MEATRSEATCSKALKTYELVEQIFMNLWIKDLLHAKQVCTHWKDVVDRSMRLHQNLFLEPQQQTYIQQEKFFPDAEEEAYDIDPDERVGWVFTVDIGLEEVKFHPCIPSVNNPDFRVYDGMGWQCDVKQEDWERILALSNKQALSMFVSQPPMVSISVYPMGGYSQSISNENGITMAELVDCMKGVMKEVVPDGGFSEALWVFGRVKAPKRSTFDWGRPGPL